jgi:hypothetical protein
MNERLQARDGIIELRWAGPLCFKNDLQSLTYEFFRLAGK